MGTRLVKSSHLDVITIMEYQLRLFLGPGTTSLGQGSFSTYLPSLPRKEGALHFGKKHNVQNTIKTFQ